MHGGTIVAHSQGVGKGSEFTVRLPLAAVAQLGGEKPGPATLDGMRPLRILVVDDNRDTARTEELLLKALGHEVEVAHDGRSAIAQAHSFRPHAVLLDIGLPEMNGYEVAQTLRSQGLTDVVLVAITGYGRSDDRQRSQAAGFDEHLVKPVDRETLIRTLHDIARRVS
jgi:CheY-like chemotaxis protein